MHGFVPKMFSLFDLFCAKVHANLLQQYFIVRITNEVQMFQKKKVQLFVFIYLGIGNIFHAHNTDLYVFVAQH